MTKPATLQIPYSGMLGEASFILLKLNCTSCRLCADSLFWSAPGADFAAARFHLCGLLFQAHRRPAELRVTASIIAGATSSCSSLYDCLYRMSPEPLLVIEGSSLLAGSEDRTALVPRLLPDLRLRETQRGLPWMHLSRGRRTRGGFVGE